MQIKLIGALMFQNGVFLGPVCSVPFVLFSGFFVNFDTIPNYLYWFTYLSYIRYAFEGVIISIYGYNRPKLKCSTDFCLFKSPGRFLQELNMEDAMYWVDAAALAAIFVLLRFVCYFVLRWKVSSRS